MIQEGSDGALEVEHLQVRREGVAVWCAQNLKEVGQVSSEPELRAHCPDELGTRLYVSVKEPPICLSHVLGTEPFESALVSRRTGHEGGLRTK